MRDRYGAASLVLFMAALLLETGYCFLHPIAYFDSFAYVSLAQGRPVVNRFSAVGQSCAAALPGAYAGCEAVTSSQVFQQAGALDDTAFNTFLRFYTVKPFYNGMVAASAGTLGGNAWRALRVISAGSYLLIGLVCVVWLRRLMAPAWAAGAALCLVSLPGALGLGRGLLPDASLTALLLLGTALLVTGRAWWLGGAALVLATLVRSDALLFAVALGVMLVWRCTRSTSQRLVRLGVLLAAARAWGAGLLVLTRALPWRVLFVHSFLAWTPPAQYGALRVSPAQYLHVMGSNGVRTVLFCLPLPALLAVLALYGRGSPAMRDAVWAAVVATVAHLLLYPGVEDRYYVWLVLLAGVAIAESIGQMRLWVDDERR